jgi:DnaJ-class molecular chaperone
VKYYQLLGVPSDASEGEIKTAYRRLARKFHPDSGQPGDVERFREIQEAYEVLSDPEKRRHYDGVRSHAVPVSWTGGFEEPIPAFREVFARAPRVEPVDLDIVLSEREAARGGEAVLDVAKDVECGDCGGSGFGFYGWCPSCRGEKIVRARERIRFRIPPGAESGDVIQARAGDGSSVRARIRVSLF